MHATTTRGRARAEARTAMHVLALLVLGLVGCGDIVGGLGAPNSRNNGDPNDAPSTSGEVGAMQAIAQLIVASDEGGTTYAQLNVLTTDDGVRALTGVSDAFLEVGAERRSLPTTPYVGTFAMSADDATLQPGAGDLVRFGYRITDTEGEQTDVELVVEAPPLTLEAELPPGLIYYAGEILELEVRNWRDGGWVQVYGPDGALTYSTLETTVDAAPDSLAAIRGVRGPVIRVPAVAFPTSGTYAIELVTLSIADASGDGLSSGLGSWSYVAAGQRIELSYVAE